MYIYICLPYFEVFVQTKLTHRQRDKMHFMCLHLLFPKSPWEKMRQYECGWEKTTWMAEERLVPTDKEEDRVNKPIVFPFNFPIPHFPRRPCLSALFLSAKNITKQKTYLMYEDELLKSVLHKHTRNLKTGIETEAKNNKTIFFIDSTTKEERMEGYIHLNA